LTTNGVDSGSTTPDSTSPPRELPSSSDTAASTSDCATGDDGTVECIVQARQGTPSIGSSSTKTNRRVALKGIFATKSNTSLDNQPRAQLVSERLPNDQRPIPPAVSTKGFKLVQVGSISGI